MMNTVYVFEISSQIILYFTVNKKVSSPFWTVLLSSWKGSVVFEVIYIIGKDCKYSKEVKSITANA